MAPEHIHVRTGMELPSRMLWYFGWNTRPIYTIAVVFGVLGAIAVHSAAGMMAALIPLFARYKATVFVNNACAAVLDLAKATVAKAGAERVGVPLENSEHFSLAVPMASPRPFGIRPAPEYTIS